MRQPNRGTDCIRAAELHDMIRRLETRDAHEEYREHVRSFCEADVRSLVEEHEASGTFPHELVPVLGEEGFIGVPTPRCTAGADPTTGRSQSRWKRSPVSGSSSLG